MSTNSYEIISDCLKNGHKNYSLPQAQLAVKHQYMSFCNTSYGYKHHSTYNKLFFLACTFELSKLIQRRTAWGLVSNGLAGYWQWQPGGGYDLQALLRSLGITAGIPAEIPDELYVKPDRALLVALVQKFDLPTDYFPEHPEQQSRLFWSQSEVAFREKSEQLYQSSCSSNHTGPSLLDEVEV